VAPQLRTMSVDKLLALRSQVEAALSTKVAAQRQLLESELSKLERLNGGGAKRGRPSLRGSSVAPKYRNPDNPAETWAGRGLRPRWLSAAIKAGHKLEDFSIDAPRSAAKGGVKKAGRRGRPPTK
jgi:DNA-binding protein H-NS